MAMILMTMMIVEIERIAHRRDDDYYNDYDDNDYDDDIDDDSDVDDDCGEN